MKAISARSPNFDARVGPPDMMVLHYTGMVSGEAALGRLTDPQARVSAHYLVEEDGRVFALVPEERRAWHAGQSFWRGQTNINGASIGVEIVNPGHDLGYRPFPEAQLAAVIDLLADVRSRWTIPDERILGHSDVAPRRKIDPGELFPWKRLADAGHGLWVEPAPAPGVPLAAGDSGLEVLILRSALARLGYDCPRAGDYDGDLDAIVRAFQRHWRPDRVDGVADGDTRARLMALVRLAPPDGRV
jgi:N-acetylmuramoyl-L-alanine amidase